MGLKTWPKEINMKTTTTWISGQEFQSEQEGRGSIKVDAAAGFSPKALLLTGLAACSGIDVVDILEKMRVPYSKLVVDAETEQTEEHPRVFKDIHLVYHVNTDEANREKIIKAIDLSLEKYCGVAAMLKKNSKIGYSLVLSQEV
jgi:putative redox protein